MGGWVVWCGLVWSGGRLSGWMGRQGVSLFAVGAQWTQGAVIVCARSCRDAASEGVGVDVDVDVDVGVGVGTRRTLMVGRGRWGCGGRARASARRFLWAEERCGGY